MPHNSWASSASGVAESKNIKFAAHFRGASSNVNEATGDRAGNHLHNNGTSANAHARVAAGLDLNVNGDCVSAQRLSTGVLNFESETLMQTFQTCDRGRITEIKMATPFVEPGFTYEYALAYTNGDVICGGSFTSDDATDGAPARTRQGRRSQGPECHAQGCGPDGCPPCRARLWNQ